MGIRVPQTKELIAQTLTITSKVGSPKVCFQTMFFHINFGLICQCKNTHTVCFLIIINTIASLPPKIKIYLPFNIIFVIIQIQ